MVPDSTPRRFANSQLVVLPPVGIFNKFLFNLQSLFAYFSARHFETYFYFITFDTQLKTVVLPLTDLIKHLHFKEIGDVY